MVENVIIILILAAVIGGAGHYVYKRKKSGVKCVACPYSKTCSGGCDNKGN